MSEEFCIGISETLDILAHMDRSYVDKIPEKFLKFLEENKSRNYISNLDYSKKINEMQLKDKTKDILAIIYMKYWCTQEERSSYMNLLRENERNYQKKIKEKYNPDNMFKNRNIKNETIQPTQSHELITLEPDGIWSRIKTFFRNLFFGKSKKNIEKIEKDKNEEKVKQYKEENIATELKREYRKSQLKSEIIEMVEINPEALKEMNNQRLKDLNNIYDEKINKNELKIKELKNELQRLKQNNT